MEKEIKYKIDTNNMTQYKIQNLLIKKLYCKKKKKKSADWLLFYTQFRS